MKEKGFFYESLIILCILALALAGIVHREFQRRRAEAVLGALVPVKLAQAEYALIEDIPEKGYLLDLNRADAEQLQSIKGIGPVIARRILEYREEAGTFASLDQLLQVPGIGQALLEEMRPYLYVGE